MTNEADTPTTQTDTQTTHSDSIVTSALGVEGRLFANKFKSVEELEKAYGNSVSAYNEKAKLEKELERYKVPEDYSIPEDVPLRNEDFEEIKYIAKNAKLTQEQFELTTRNMADKIQQQHAQLEERRKAIGEDKLTLINDYVTKHIPEYARDVVLNKLIRDDKAMSDALKDRDQRLNSQAPGMSQAGGNVPERFDGQKELSKAASEFHRNPRDRQAQQRYLDLCRDVGHARMDKR